LKISNRAPPVRSYLIERAKRESFLLAAGIWQLASGSWHLAAGIWQLASV